MMKKFEVEVIRTVTVELDETKFTEEFLDEFSKYISPSIDDLLTHVEHLAWAFAAGRVDNRQFIEGYGHTEDFCIRFEELDDFVSDIKEIY